MKKSMLIFASLLMVSLTSFAQYASKDYVGTWERNSNELKLYSDGSAKLKASDGSTVWGKWERKTSWSGSSKADLNITVPDGTYYYEVISLNSKKMKLRNKTDNRYYTFNNKYASSGSSVTAAEAGAVLLGTLLLYSLFSGDSGSNSSYDQSIQQAANEKQARYDMLQSEQREAERAARARRGY